MCHDVTVTMCALIRSIATHHVFSVCVFWRDGAGCHKTTTTDLILHINKDSVVLWFIARSGMRTQADLHGHTHTNGPLLCLDLVSLTGYVWSLLGAVATKWLAGRKYEVCNDSAVWLTLLMTWLDDYELLRKEVTASARKSYSRSRWLNVFPWLGLWWVMLCRLCSVCWVLCILMTIYLMWL